MSGGRDQGVSSSANPGRTWARSKLDWLDQVADDLESDHLAFRVAHAIMRVTDRDTGIADRSQADLAKRVRASVRHLQSAIGKLETRGHLVVIRPANPKRGNRYRPVLQTVSPHTQSASYETGSHAQPTAHETSLFHTQSASHEKGLSGEVSYAKSDDFIRSPLRTDSRIDPRDPRAAPSASSHSVPRATATKAEAAAAASRISDQDLWNELWCAAAGRIEDGPETRYPQPIRDLMAGGVDLDLQILPAIGELALALRDPLRTWRAPMVMDAINRQKLGAVSPASTAVQAPTEPTAPLPDPAPAAPPPMPIRPAPPRTPRRRAKAARSFGSENGDPPAEDVHRIGTRIVSASDLRLTVNAFFERGLWPDELGPPPGAPGSLVPSMAGYWSSPLGENATVRLPGQMPRPEETVWSVVRLYREGGMPWPEFFGTEPGTPGCLLPQRFQDGALAKLKSEENNDG